MKRKTHERVSISVPLATVARLDKFRGSVNVSAVCSEALHGYLCGLERDVVMAQWRQLAMAVASATPEEAAMVWQRKDELPVPVLLVAQLAVLQPHEQEAAFEGWSDGLRAWAEGAKP